VEAASSPVVTTSGDEGLLVQTEALDDEGSDQVVEAILASTGASADDLSQSELGASWGREIAERSTIGLIVFLVLVVLFIWAYFREWKMSVAALVALAHDVLITVGVYTLSGFEVTPATVTGLLTILGFSLYDTVVVFDKVRENTKNLRKTRMTYAEAANLAVNQTLVRSINTSIVALIPVGAILYVGVFQLGSGSLKDLALALFVGMAVGLYSSVFIATPLLVHLKGLEKTVQESDRRAQVRRRHDADRYASVPTFREDLPVSGDADDVEGLEDDDSWRRPVPTASGGSPGPTRPAQPTRPAAGPDEAGRGRVVPPAHGPVKESRSSGRVQPTRQSRSKRGKK
jgi:preprotein translocase subunit SecF